MLVDLCSHNFKVFREEIGDVHLGFDLNYVKSELEKVFGVEKVEKMSEGCKCESSGRSTELFIAIAKN